MAVWFRRLMRLIIGLIKLRSGFADVAAFENRQP
jgi:hypothetical protein